MRSRIETIFVKFIFSQWNKDSAMKGLSKLKYDTRIILVSIILRENIQCGPTLTRDL